MEGAFVTLFAAKPAEIAEFSGEMPPAEPPYPLLSPLSLRVGAVNVEVLVVKRARETAFRESPIQYVVEARDVTGVWAYPSDVIACRLNSKTLPSMVAKMHRRRQRSRRSRHPRVRCGVYNSARCVSSEGRVRRRQARKLKILGRRSRHTDRVDRLCLDGKSSIW